MCARGGCAAGREFVSVLYHVPVPLSRSENSDPFTPRVAGPPPGAKVDHRGLVSSTRERGGRNFSSRAPDFGSVRGASVPKECHPADLPVSPPRRWFVSMPAVSRLALSSSTLVFRVNVPQITLPTAYGDTQCLRRIMLPSGWTTRRFSASTLSGRFWTRSGATRRDRTFSGCSSSRGSSILKRSTERSWTSGARRRRPRG